MADRQIRTLGDRLHLDGDLADTNGDRNTAPPPGYFDGQSDELNDAGDLESTQDPRLADDERNRAVDDDAPMKSDGDRYDNETDDLEDVHAHADPARHADAEKTGQSTGDQIGGQSTHSEGEIAERDIDDSMRFNR